MKEPRNLYKANFPCGSHVRVAPRDALDRFARDWKFHNPLQPEQLAFAGVTAIVRDIGYYHGGDVLYQLQDVPGIWHEACLVAASVG